jgi:hypothetical protein
MRVNGSMDNEIFMKSTVAQTIKGNKASFPTYWMAERRSDTEYLVTYFLIYAYDNKSGLSALASHTIDRESVSLKFKKVGASWIPADIFYSGHLPDQSTTFLGCSNFNNCILPGSLAVQWNLGKTSVQWENASKFLDNPIVYVAKGSHAMAPAFGWYQGYLRSQEIAGNSISGDVVSGYLEELDLNLPAHSALVFSGALIDKPYDKVNLKIFPFTRYPISSWASTAGSDFNTCVSLKQGCEGYISRQNNLKKGTSAAITRTSTTLSTNWLNRTLYKSLALLGITDALAQSVSDLFAFTSTSYTVRVDGTGFDNNEAVTVEGSTCDVNTIQRGTGYFTQTCQGGSQAGNSYKIRVYDTQYDLDIELPPAYQFMSLRGPVLAPTAPVLTDLGSGTIRSTWGAVVGATGYELSSGQTLIAATGASQTTYDHANQLAGSQVCYRVRAIASSVPSANSAETCITLAAPKCSGQWVAGQYVVGQTESTTQNCSVGYSGNKQLTHTCQANGSWGATTTQDNCTLIPPVTCSGTWSVAQYLVNQTETKTEACTGGQTGSVITNHICRANGTWGPSLETISCTCPAGKVLTNGVCTTPAPTSCNGSWTNTAYAIGAVEEQFANACPAGTVGQVRSFHTCQAGGTWSPTANSDNCTAVLVAPTNLIASSVAAGGSSGVAGIQLVWTAVPGATRYYINRNGEANYSSQAVTNWTDPNVVSGTQYCYTLNAFSNFNNSRSPASSQVCATYQPTQIIILPPTNVAAAQYISGGRKAIRLTWTSANGADSYQVYRLDRSGIFATLAGADTSFIDWPELSLTSGGSYAYVIRSVKNGVVSPDSNVGQAIAP